MRAARARAGSYRLLHTQIFAFSQFVLCAQFALATRKDLFLHTQAEHGRYLVQRCEICQKAE